MGLSVRPTGHVAADAPVLEADESKDSSEAGQQNGQQDPQGELGVYQVASGNQRVLIRGVEHGAVMPVGVGKLLAADTQEVERGRGEVLEGHPADGSRHLLLIVEAVANVAGEDVVPVGPVHNMVMVLLAGLLGRPGNDGSRRRKVPHLDIHPDPATRIRVKSDLPLITYL